MQDKINFISDNKRIDFRANSSNISNKFLNKNYENYIKSDFEQMGKMTNEFLTRNKDIVVTNSDKGNVTVLMDKHNYNDE